MDTGSKPPKPTSGVGNFSGKPSPSWANSVSGNPAVKPEPPAHPATDTPTSSPSPQIQAPVIPGAKENPPSSPSTNKKKLVYTLLALFLLLGLSIGIWQLSKVKKIAEIFLGEPAYDTWAEQNCAVGIANGVNSKDSECCCNDPGSSSRCGSGCAFKHEPAYDDSMGTVIQFCQSDGTGSDGNPKFKVTWRSRDQSHCDEEGLCSGIDDPNQTSGNCSQCNNKWKKPSGTLPPPPPPPPPPGSSPPPPGASPSPPPPDVSLVCADLVRSPTTSLNIGDTVNFTCTGTASNVTIDHYEYQYRVDTGSWQVLNIPSLTVDQTGVYLVQCRACSSADDTKCTTWGQAGGWTP